MKLQLNLKFIITLKIAPHFTELTIFDNYYYNYYKVVLNPNVIWHLLQFSRVVIFFFEC